MIASRPDAVLPGRDEVIRDWAERCQGVYR